MAKYTDIKQKKKVTVFLKIQNANMDEDKVFSFPIFQMFDEDELSEFEDLELGEEGEEKKEDAEDWDEEAELEEEI